MKVNRQMLLCYRCNLDYNRHAIKFDFKDTKTQ